MLIHRGEVRIKMHHACYENVPGFQRGYEVGDFLGGAASLRQ